MRKLEPILPLPQKSAKFKSPYKSPQITNKQHIQQSKSSNSHKENAVNPLQPEADSSTNITNKIPITPKQGSAKLGEGFLSDVSARNEKVITTKDLSRLPKMSSVKIQPIDPYKFCEPILKDCVKSSVTRKDMVFKRTKEEQVWV